MKSNFQLSNCQLFYQWDFMLFLSSRSKSEKSSVLTVLTSIWTKFSHFSLFTANLRRLFPSFIPGICLFWAFVIAKKNWRYSFLCVCSLIDDKFRHNISLACGFWFHSHLIHNNRKTRIKTWRQFVEPITRVDPLEMRKRSTGDTIFKCFRSYILRHIVMNTSAEGAIPLLHQLPLSGVKIRKQIITTT